jgi:hypothetical protein
MFPWREIYLRKSRFARAAAITMVAAGLGMAGNWIEPTGLVVCCQVTAGAAVDEADEAGGAVDRAQAAVSTARAEVQAIVRWARAWRGRTRPRRQCSPIR